MDTLSLAKNQQLNSLRYRRAAARVHRIGTRAVTELLAEAGVEIELIERYARLDELPPAFLKAIGACGWPPDLFEVAL